MKLGQKICLNNILDKFENGFGWYKNIAARGQGIFPYMAKVKNYEHSKSHIYCPIFVKRFLEKHGLNGAGIFPYMAIYYFSKTP